MPSFTLYASIIHNLTNIEIHNTDGVDYLAMGR